jgi:molybdate transport system regulatory protein
VPVPDRLARELRGLLQDPSMMVRERAHEEGWFHVDQGYLRRVFYARAKECGLSQELANPRVLRNSRAVELLRSGVPLGVVRHILGQSSTDLTSVFQHFSQGAANSLVRSLALRDLPSRTSARNTFLGQISQVRCDGVMADVCLETEDKERLYAVITQESLTALGLEVGAPVAATVKAPLVDVFQLGATPGSARNRFRATITSMRSSDVLTEVSGRTGLGNKLCALVSAESVKELGLSVGDDAVFLFKALSVVLNTV